MYAQPLVVQLAILYRKHYETWAYVAISVFRSVTAILNTMFFPEETEADVAPRPYNTMEALQFMYGTSENKIKLIYKYNDSFHCYLT